jgi:Methyltransferase domain
MPDLLIHSMSEFGEIITGAMDLAGVRDVVEIGAEFGGMTTTLADRCRAWEGCLVSVDPCPKPEFEAWAATRPDVHHVRALSLDAIPGLAAPDAWVIDGDHNWYTVYHELKAAEAVSRGAARPFFAFLHDVEWPSGRRDMYYAPESIPAEFRHAYSYEGGAFPGHSALYSGRGFRGAGHFAWAKHEGGPRNGVLTAIEDFLAEADKAGNCYAYAQVPAVFGLGIIIPADAAWCEAVAQLLLPYHDNSLLRSLEQNRLVNYLTVLEGQDRLAA